MEEVARANEQVALAHERMEVLRAENLKPEVSLGEVRWQVRGREISDSQQQQQITSAARSLKLPDFTVYFLETDVEASFYATSIVGVLQDIEMKGRTGLLASAPSNVGVIFCGTGKVDEVGFFQLLAKAKVVTLSVSVPSEFFS